MGAYKEVGAGRSMGGRMAKKTDGRLAGWRWVVSGRPFSTVVSSEGSGARCLGFHLSSSIPLSSGCVMVGKQIILFGPSFYYL